MNSGRISEYPWRDDAECKAIHLSIVTKANGWLFLSWHYDTSRISMEPVSKNQRGVTRCWTQRPYLCFNVKTRLNQTQSLCLSHNYDTRDGIVMKTHIFLKINVIISYPGHKT